MIDEAWAAVRHGARHFQASLKLSRTYGVVHLAGLPPALRPDRPSRRRHRRRQDRRRAALRHPDPGPAPPTPRPGRRRRRAVRPHRTRTLPGSANSSGAGRCGGCSAAAPSSRPCSPQPNAELFDTDHAMRHERRREDQRPPLADRRRARPHRPRRPARRARRARRPTASAAGAGTARCPTTTTTTPRSPCTPTTAATNAGAAGPATTPPRRRHRPRRRHPTRHPRRRHRLARPPRRHDPRPAPPARAPQAAAPPRRRSCRSTRPSSSYVDACERILWTRPAGPCATGSTHAASTTTSCAPTRSAPTPAAQLMRRRRGLPYGRPASPPCSPPSTRRRLRYVQARYLDPGDGPKYDNPAAALGSNPRLAWTQPDGPTATRRARRLRRHPRRPHRRPGRLPRRRRPRLPNPRPAASPPASPTTPSDHDLAIVAVIDTDPAGRAWGERLDDLLADHGHRPRRRRTTGRGPRPQHLGQRRPGLGPTHRD